jgi:hypothetical protein
MGYSRMNYEDNNCKALTSIATVNQFENISRFNLLENSCDKEIFEAFVIHNGLGSNTNEILYNNFTHERMARYVKCSILNNFSNYLRLTWHKIVNLGNETTRSTLALNVNGFFGIPDILANLFSIRFIILYLILVIDLIINLIIFLRYRQVNWIRIFIWLFIVGQFVTITLGSFAEYQRLFSIALPYVTILIFSYFDFLLFSIDKTKLKKYLNILK